MRSLIFRGPVLTASGYGVHARQLLKAIIDSKRFDVSVESCNWGNTSFILDRSDSFFKQIDALVVKGKYESGKQYDVSVQVTIPNEFKKMAAVNIGVTAGIETNRVSPEWITKINENIDLVVVPSRHSFDTLVKVGYNHAGGVLRVEKPAIVAPEGVPVCFVPAKDKNPLWEELSIPDKKCFLVVGLGLDKPFGEDRKNISTTIKLFLEQFSDMSDEVCLVVKGGIVNNSASDRFEFEKRVRSIVESVPGKKHPEIRIIHGRLSDEQMAALYTHPNIIGLVSLTHGEGWGLPILEATACDLPVIATDWSGHLDILTSNEGEKLFVPVEFDLAAVPESCVWPGVIEQGSLWAYPKIDRTKLLLRKFCLNPKKPREWAEKLGKLNRERFSQERTGQLFVRYLLDFVEEYSKNSPRTEDDAVRVLKERFQRDVPTILFTMPMSAGDVFLSTGTITSLRISYPNHHIIFATDPRYFSILEGNTDIDEVVPWEQWMTHVPLLERIFDRVYTPNLSIQTTTSNWIKRGQGRNLIDEIAHLCDETACTPYIAPVKPESWDDALNDNFIAFCPGSGKGQWEARNYHNWQDVVSNLVENTGLKVVHVGTVDEPEYTDVVDFRGKTLDYREMAYVLKSAKCVVGIDSCQLHIASSFDVPTVGIYGSSYAKSTGPTRLHLPIESETRGGCERACYKYQCTVDRENPCVNEIDSRQIYEGVCKSIFIDAKSILDLYVERVPKISGYTHMLDPTKQGFPWIESITSMLGFCSEVIVVDGGSTDGSLEKLNQLAAADSRIKVYSRKWDWNEPGMDGMQKAYGRALCSEKFLWQQDLDEIVHEDDYVKIHKLIKRFPADVDIIDLPMIELWGDGKTCRTDRHTWKWRLSRNNFMITHGINKDARVFDRSTGKTYAKKGMSDGCEYVNLMDYTYFPHRGFYSDELELLRRTDPDQFGVRMNKIYSELPSVYHYSWCDIPRKIRNFRDFWDKCWNNLYNESSREPRFPNIETDEQIAAKAEELRLRGGEHGAAATFRLDRTNPSVMNEWLSRI